MQLRPVAVFASAAMRARAPPRSWPAVQIDQAFRRLSWRLRRWFTGAAADNDPVVTLETPAPSPPSPRPARRGGWGPASTLLLVIGLAAVAWTLLIR